MKVSKDQQTIQLPERVITVSEMIWMTGVTAAVMMIGVSSHTIRKLREKQKLGQFVSVQPGQFYYSQDADPDQKIEVFPPFPCDGDVEIVTHVIKRF